MRELLGQRRNDGVFGRNAEKRGGGANEESKGSRRGEGKAHDGKRRKGILPGCFAMLEEGY